jgi:hypothetical protein
MDVKSGAKSSVTSGGGVQNNPGTASYGSGTFVTFHAAPTPEVLLEIPPKHHSIRVLRLPDGELRLVLEEVDGIYTGDAIHALFDDINAAMSTVQVALTEEEDEDYDEDDFEDEVDDEDIMTESEDAPPPVIKAQADGDAQTFGTGEMPEATFCECADCRRRRL